LENARQRWRSWVAVSGAWLGGWVGYSLPLIGPYGGSNGRD